jgi:triacylglycerol esterase/lipase EstA (alpha/beta hydrolase family)
MELKDYIQYYIGCRCVNSWFPEDHDMYNANWVLEAYCSKDIKPYKLDNENTFTWTDSIKPILRKLEDMSIHEAISLTSLVVHSAEFVNPKVYRNTLNDLIVGWGGYYPM